MKTSLLTAGILLAFAGVASAQYATPGNYDLYSGYAGQAPASYARGSSGTAMTAGYRAPAASSSYYYPASQLTSYADPAVPTPAPVLAPTALPPDSGTNAPLLSSGSACNSGACDFGTACGGCGAQWNVGLDALIMGRLSACSYPFVREFPAPGDPPGTVTPTLLDTGSFDYSWEFGYRITAAYMPACGWGLEFGFFGFTDSWGVQDGVTGPYQFHGGGFAAPDPDDGLVRTFDVCNQTRFYSTQLNAIHGICDWATLRVGLRWIRIEDELSVDGAEVGTTPLLLYHANLRNDPIGPQVGADFKLLDLCCSRLRLYATTNVGLLYNHIEFDQQSDWFLKHNSATCNELAVLGELALMAKWRVSDHIAVRAGYQVLGLNGVGLAATQLAANDMNTYYARLEDSSLIVHGATVGCEFFW
jgi:hypothetical protein